MTIKKIFELSIVISSVAENTVVKSLLFFVFVNELPVNILYMATFHSLLYAFDIYSWIPDKFSNCHTCICFLPRIKYCKSLSFGSSRSLAITFPRFQPAYVRRQKGCDIQFVAVKNMQLQQCCSFHYHLSELHI